MKKVITAKKNSSTKNKTTKISIIKNNTVKSQTAKTALIKTGLSESIEILNLVAKKVKYPNEIIQLISNPELQTLVNFIVPMDSGVNRVFYGLRSRFSTLLGPAKGGIRFHSAVDAELVNKLAFEMMVKCSIAGLPFGGGKGGVVVNPSELSDAEIERVSRGYMQAIHGVIGEDIDVPAPDMGTNAKIMGYMLDEYEKIIQKKAPAVITGKPVENGGSLFRTEATGYGVSHIIKIFSKTLKLKPQQTKVAIHGFGNLGSYAAEFLHTAGYKVIAISDSGGGLYKKDGIDMAKFLTKYKSLKVRNLTLYSHELEDEIKEYKKISNDELLTLEVDFLIPAAIDNVITEKNASKVKAKYIVEGANAPVNNAADVMLNKAGVIIIPDVLANSGGVTVSYFEWYQNKHNEKWNEAKVKKELEVSLEKAFKKIYDTKDKFKNLNFREAAYLVALENLEKALNTKYSFKNIAK